VKRGEKEEAVKRILIVVAALALLLGASEAAHAKKGFSGVVQVAPIRSYAGPWVISGMPVYVTPKTRLHFNRRSPRVGTWVEVQGFSTYDGRFYASKIKEKRPKHPKRRW
jgi:hypothetical protein